MRAAAVRQSGTIISRSPALLSYSPGTAKFDNDSGAYSFLDAVTEEHLIKVYCCDARASLGRYLDFYNSRRPHSSLDGMTPDQAYCQPPLPLRLVA